jgi:hypothetical protein
MRKQRLRLFRAEISTPFLRGGISGRMGGEFVKYMTHQAGAARQGHEFD